MAEKLKSRLSAAWTAFDVRDLLVFGGMAMLGYGLYLLRPWIAFTVCGSLLMLIGYVMRGK